VQKKTVGKAARCITKEVTDEVTVHLNSEQSDQDTNLHRSSQQGVGKGGRVSQLSKVGEQIEHCKKQPPV
jgi:hypothetical protein